MLKSDHTQKHIDYCKKFINQTAQISLEYGSTKQFLLNLNYKKSRQFQIIEIYSIKQMINSLQKRPQSKSYKTHLEQARPLTRHNDQEQAQKCFQMGKQHQGRNEIEKAEKFYLQAVVHNPAHFKSYCNLGLCYKLRGQYPNSIQAYKQSLAINPKDAITNYNLANVYRLIGDEERSISHYMLVIDLKEKQGVDVGSLCLDSYNNLGICYKNIENYTQAIECFEKILKEKPTEEIVKFNLGVCYLKVIRRMRKNPLNQNSMLVKEHIVKTTSLFQQVLKNEPKNQVATLALIELSSVSNQEHQNIKKCVTELDELMKRPDTSGFVKDQGTKIRANCEILLAKYEKSAEEYRKALEQKKQEQEKRLAEQRQKQRLIKQKQEQQAKKRAEQQQKAQSTKVIPPAPQPVQKQQSVQPPQQTQVPVVQINAKQVFETMVSSLVQKLQSLIQSPEKLSKQKNLSQTLASIIQSLQKQHLSTNKDKKLSQRLRKQLSIVGCSILGENLIEREFFSEAFDTYYIYFLDRNLKAPVNKSMLFLQTHRAIASVLTSLGESEKAIEHYQLISQEFTDKNVSDKDPLQQLHSGLAVNYQSQGLHEKAIKQFEQAIRLNPSNYVFYYNLGYCQHCAGKDIQAVKSYSTFLQQIQKQTTLMDQSKHSYILQALISIFICSQGSVDERVKKCGEIEQKIVQFCGHYPQNALKLIDAKTLMHFFLLACDLYEQIIFDMQKSLNQPQVKKFKQKLFTIYINLLELPNCPDRDQILINCGNLLFQQRQFFGALQFYQKVSRSKTQVFNIIALTLMNVNEHERALNSMQVAVESDKGNKIYQINYEIMKWAYGLQITSKDNLLWQKYPCRRDSEFDSRVQYAKSLIAKLTAIIEKELTTNQSMDNLTVQMIFAKLLTDKEDTTLWKDQQALNKHESIKKHIQKNSSQQAKEFMTVDKNLIKQTLQLITTNAQTSQESIQKLITFFNQKFSNSNLKQSTDYLNILQQSLALFIYHNSKSPASLKTLKQHLQSKTPNIKTYDITFTDPVTPNAINYPHKNYTVAYPSIELKLENLINSLLSWNTALEDKFVYLLKIIQSMAYKAQLRSPSLTDYNFACCKYVENCEKCFKKACYVLAKIFNLDCKDNFITNLKQDSSLTARKKATFTAFVNKFGKNLQGLLTSKPGKDNKTLSLNLDQDTLPLQMEINFLTQADFEKFLKALCAQVSAKQPAYDKNDKQLYLTINKLVRIRCIWKETDFIEEFITTVVKSTLGLRESATEFFDGELLKIWAEDQSLKPLLSKIFDLKTFLK